MDPISEKRLSEVHPWLAHLAHVLADRLAAEGSEVRVTCGVRSWNQQLAEWLKGRDADGNIVDKSQVVTNAPPGHGWHEFGLAIDVAPFVDGTPDWNVSHPVWKRIVAVGESLGLFSGTEFHAICDTPHFQLTGKFPVSPTDEVRQLFKDGGMQAVWSEADVTAQPAPGRG